MYTKSYWDYEIAIFWMAWDEPECTPERAGHLLRGLGVIASCAFKHHPDDSFRQRVEHDLRKALHECRERYGQEWFDQHMVIYSTHAEEDRCAPCPHKGDLPQEHSKPT